MVAGHERRHLASESRRPRSGEGLCGLCRGGQSQGQPTVILAEDREGLRHGRVRRRPNDRPSGEEDGRKTLEGFRDRFQIPVADEDLANVPFIKPAENSPEMYFKARSAAGGSSCRNAAARRRSNSAIDLPASARKYGRARDSTTMAFVQITARWCATRHRQADRADRSGRIAHLRHGGFVPPARHLFVGRPALRAAGRRSADVLPRRTRRTGAAGGHQRRRRHVVLDCAATSYSTNNVPMIPFYIFYSMFGFQRVGDLAWAAGDMRARGFLLGGTAGRTTLNGEGLQHEDGTATFLRARSRIALLRSDLRLRGRHDRPRRHAPHVRGSQEDVYYYITLMNENYRIPAMRRQGPKKASLGPLQLTKGRPQPRRAPTRSADGIGHDPARSGGRCGPVQIRFRRDGRHVERKPASTNCAATVRPRNAGTCCIRRRSRAARAGSRRLAGMRAGHRRPTTCATTRTRSANMCRRRVKRYRRAGHGRLQPQRLPRQPARSSRSTAAMSWSPR